MWREVALHSCGLPDADHRHQFSGQIRAREDSDHPGHLCRGACVDALDLRVSVVAVQDGDVRHVGKRNVRGELGVPVQEFRIFTALDRSA